MYAMRLWATRHARLLEAGYNIFDPIVKALDPLWRGIGYKRLEKPFVVLETWTKGALFDCQMCGRCILRASGMSCSMNCPKTMRNGPCGGVRPDGNCEVKPEMRCVWVEACAGSEQMRASERIDEVQIPVDHRIKDTSAWLRHIEESAAETSAVGEGDVKR